VHVVVSDEEIVRRLTERQKTSGRADDHAVEERVREYYDHTEPAIQIFHDAGVLIDVDGERSPDEIATDIRAKLAVFEASSTAA
jgi:adenylate kinase